MEYINYIFGAVGFIAGLLAIYEIFIKRLYKTLPATKAEKIEKDDDYIVLSLEDKRNELNSFSYIVNDFSKKYGANEEERYWFIHMPKGQYLINNSLYIQFVFIGASCLAVSLFIVGVLLFSNQKDLSLLEAKILISLVMLFALGMIIFCFRVASKAYKRKKIVESYLHFLSENRIISKMAFLQKKKYFGRKLSK